MVITLAIASLLAQVIGFVVTGFMIYDLAGLPAVFYPDGNWAVSDLLPHALETVVSYWTALLLSVAGAATAAFLMISARYRAGWFLGVCRVVGWLWMPFLPIGPALGFMLLRARLIALRD